MKAAYLLGAYKNRKYNKLLSKKFFKRGKPRKKIKDLETRSLGAVYQYLINKCNYWKVHYKREDAYVAENDVIITLQVLYSEWKVKFVNMANFTNYVIQELLEMLKEADQLMCPKNTPC